MKSNLKPGTGERWSAKSPSQLVKMVQDGIPFKQLEAFQRRTELPWEAVGRLVRIPARTLSRRQREGRLSFDESERLLRMSRTFQKAVDFFHGDVPAARQWMLAPQRALGGEIPFEFACTEVGAREVEDILGRLAHGVFL